MMLRTVLLCVVVSSYIVGCLGASACGPNSFNTLFYTIGDITKVPPGVTSSYRTAISNADPMWFNLLNDPNQYLTVFVATDQAFSVAGISPSTSSSSFLTSLVSYSIVNASIHTNSLPNQTFVHTLLTDENGKLGGQGQYLGIRKDTHNVTLGYGADSFTEFQGRAYVDPVYSNIQACNGIIHLINRVLLPPNLLSDSLTKTGRTVSFIYASLKSAPPTELLGDLDTTPKYTIFAPADTAFSSTYGDELHSISPSKWSTILSLHVVPRVIFTTDMFNGEDIVTLGGLKLNVTKSGHEGLHVNGARFIQPDIITQNGVLHVIDHVLQPPSSVSVAQY